MGMTRGIVLICTLTLAVSLLGDVMETQILKKKIVQKLLKLHL